MSASELELLADLWPLFVAVMITGVLCFLLGHWSGSRERKAAAWEQQEAWLAERHRRNRAEHAAVMAVATQALAPVEVVEAAVDVAVAGREPEPVMAGSDLPPRGAGIGDATKLLADFSSALAGMDALAEHGRPKPRTGPVAEPPIDPPPPPVRPGVADAVAEAVDDGLDVEPTPDDEDEVPRDESRVTSLSRSSGGDTDMQPPVEVVAHRYAWPASAFGPTPPASPEVRGVFPKGWGWLQRRAWRLARALRAAVDAQVARRREVRRQRELSRAERAESVTHVGWRPGELAGLVGVAHTGEWSPRLAEGAGVHRRKRIEREKRQRVSVDTQSWTMPAPLRLSQGWKQALAVPRTLAGVR